MKVFILRHGTTVWNEKGITQGRSQNRLSKNGKILAIQTAEKLSNEKIDKIYSSPLMRTMQTANIVNKFHGVQIIKTELLTEVGQGIFTGRVYKKLTEEEKKLKKERHPSTKMETYDDAYVRTKEFVETVLKQETNKNILIVSHNMICSMIYCILKNEKIDFNDRMKTNSFENAEVRKIEI